MSERWSYDRVVREELGLGGMPGPLPGWLKRLVEIGALSSDSEELRIRKAVIDAQGPPFARAVQVQATDVIDLLHKLRIGRQLELLLAVRLQTEGLPGPPHRILRDTQMRRPDRVQCVTFFGVLSKVVVTIFSTCSSVTAPGPSRPRLVQQAPHAVARRTGCATWSPSGARPRAFGTS